MSQSSFRPTKMMGKPFRRGYSFHKPTIEYLEDRTLLAANFQGLGALPGSGGSFYSDAFGVSADGRVVVGRSSSASGFQAFRWTAETGMVGLGVLPGGFNSLAKSVSADGQVIVGESSSSRSGREGFRWTAATGMVGLGLLQGAAESPAFAISGDGHVIVGFSGSSSTGATEAYRWTEETGVVGLGFLPGSTRSNALAVSGDGHVVVGSSPITDGRGAFRWTAETGMIDLGRLPGDNTGTFATAVSSDGEVVVGVTGVGPFRWTAETGMVSLSSRPEDAADYPNGVSADGNVVVGSYIVGATFKAFIWDSVHGLRDMRDVLVTDYNLGDALSGWQLFDALGISPDGRNIVGVGIDPQGNYEAWVVHLPAVAAPSVTCSVANSLLWPPNHRLVNVGFDVAVDPPDANLHLMVFGNDHAAASDVADIAPNTLRLRSEHQGAGEGRIYLIVATAENAGGSGFDVCTVAVPQNHSPAALAAARRQAADVEAFYRDSQTPPPGFALLGMSPSGEDEPGQEKRDRIQEMNSAPLIGARVSGSFDAEAAFDSVVPNALHLPSDRHQMFSMPGLEFHPLLEYQNKLPASIKRIADDELDFVISELDPQKIHGSDLCLAHRGTIKLASRIASFPRRHPPDCSAEER